MFSFDHVPRWVGTEAKIITGIICYKAGSCWLGGSFCGSIQNSGVSITQNIPFIKTLCSPCHQPILSCFPATNIPLPLQPKTLSSARQLIPMWYVPLYHIRPSFSLPHLPRLFHAHWPMLHVSLEIVCYNVTVKNYYWIVTWLELLLCVGGNTAGIRNSRALTEHIFNSSMFPSLFFFQTFFQQLIKSYTTKFFASLPITVNITLYCRTNGRCTAHNEHQVPGSNGSVVASLIELKDTKLTLVSLWVEK